jgi:hypothetical protein
VALLVAFWFVACTLRAVIGAGEELIWPEKIACGQHLLPDSFLSSA